MSKRKKKLKWKSTPELLELVKVLSPYFSNADIGRILDRDRRTIHLIKKMYGIKNKEAKEKLPIFIIKPKKYYEEEKNG